MNNRSPLLFLLILILALGAIVNAELTVHYIDVGQGDSELLQSNGHNMLIDAGPTTAGESVVSYLKDLGITSLDVVVATHPHEDHIGGMVDVLNSFPVGLYVDNGEPTTTKTYENVMEKLNAKQIPYTEVTTGKFIPFADVITVQVINPSFLTGDLNEDSIVLKVTDGSEKFLFMGDSSKVSSDPSAQILKVTHHGSNSGSSLSFLSQVKPEIAIIEVGMGNTYGHPTQNTLSNLEKAGTKVYRTDLNGNIIVKSDGKSYTINSEKESDSSSQVVTTPAKSSSPVYTTPVQSDAPIYSVPTSSISGTVCDCSGNKYNCGDFPLPNGVTAQQCYEYCKSQGKGDIHKLDGDKDGSVCEG